MADEFKDIRRIESPDLETNLIERQLGFTPVENADSLYKMKYKADNRSISTFIPEGGRPHFKSVTVDEVNVSSDVATKGYVDAKTKSENFKSIRPFLNGFVHPERLTLTFTESNSTIRFTSKKEDGTYEQIIEYYADGNKYDLATGVSFPLDLTIHGYNYVFLKENGVFVTVSSWSKAEAGWLPILVGYREMILDTASGKAVGELISVTPDFHGTTMDTATRNFINANNGLWIEWGLSVWSVKSTKLDREEGYVVNDDTSFYIAPLNDTTDGEYIYPSIRPGVIGMNAIGWGRESYRQYIPHGSENWLANISSSESGTYFQDGDTLSSVKGTGGWFLYFVKPDLRKNTNNDQFNNDVLIPLNINPVPDDRYDGLDQAVRDTANHYPQLICDWKVLGLMYVYNGGIVDYLNIANFELKDLRHGGLLESILGNEKVQSDWNELDSGSPAFINNKPDVSSKGLVGSLNVSDGDGGWAQAGISTHSPHQGVNGLEFGANEAHLRAHSLTLIGTGANGTSSNVKVAQAPLGDYDIANKQYVDNKFNTISGGGTFRVVSTQEEFLSAVNDSVGNIFIATNSDYLVIDVPEISFKAYETNLYGDSIYFFNSAGSTLSFRGVDDNDFYRLVCRNNVLVKGDVNPAWNIHYGDIYIRNITVISSAIIVNSQKPDQANSQEPDPVLKWECVQPQSGGRLTGAVQKQFWDNTAGSIDPNPPRLDIDPALPPSVTVSGLTDTTWNGTYTLQGSYYRKGAEDKYIGNGHAQNVWVIASHPSTPYYNGVNYTTALHPHNQEWASITPGLGEATVVADNASPSSRAIDTNGDIVTTSTMQSDGGFVSQNRLGMGWSNQRERAEIQFSPLDSGDRFAVMSHGEEKFLINTNGVLSAPAANNADIAGSPKALVTKEYADANYSGGGGGSMLTYGFSRISWAGNTSFGPNGSSDVNSDVSHLIFKSGTITQMSYFFEGHNTNGAIKILRNGNVVYTSPDVASGSNHNGLISNLNIPVSQGQKLSVVVVGGGQRGQITIVVEG